MKYKISFILLIGIITFALSSCGKGIKEDEAKEHVNLFFDAVESENYDEAGEYMHPDRENTLDEFFAALEMGLGVDFQEGIQIVDYVSQSSVLYDSVAEGSTYELEMEVLVGNTTFDIIIELVRNNNGFGISNYNFTPRY